MATQNTDALTSKTVSERLLDYADWLSRGDCAALSEGEIADLVYAAAEIARLERSLSTAETAITNMTIANFDKDDIIARLERELADANEKILKVEHAISETRGDRNRLEHELEAERMCHESASASNEKNRARIESLAEQLETMHAVNNTQAERIRALEDAIKWVINDMGYKPPEMAAEMMSIYHTRLQVALQPQKTEAPHTWACEYCGHNNDVNVRQVVCENCRRDRHVA